MRKMKNLFCNTAFIFIFLSCACGVAQNGNPITTKVNIPTSPEIALLGRFGDIPIGYYTGTASISIPLYTIEENGVRIPLSLDYHSSGIKIDDEATWVGLGWSMVPEFSIVQEIRGKSDDMDNFNIRLTQDPDGYGAFKNRLNSSAMGAYKGFTEIGDFNSCSENNAIPIIRDSPYVISSLELNNGEPDIYTYNFSGYSGKFYINPDTQKIVQLDKETEIDFQKIGNNSFIATTMEGNRYYFDILETAHGTNPAVEQAGYTMKVSSIALANGKTFGFEYVSEKHTGRTFTQSSIINYACTPSPPPTGPAVSIFNTSDIKTISKISTPEVLIDFNLETREDVLYNTAVPENNMKRLKSIDIRSAITGKKIKTYEFGYSYFISNYSSSAYGKRLKLDFLKEISYDDNGIADRSKPEHKFEYEMGINMPEKSSFARDFWGYYNGADGNSGLLPDLAYFDYEYSTEFQDYSVLPGRYPFRYNHTSSNRYADNTKAGAYILKKITYPTKGYTEFEYEPHTFTNQFIPNQSQFNNSPNAINTVYKTEMLIDQNITFPDYIPSNEYPFTKKFKISRSVTIRFQNSIYDGTGGPAGEAGIYSRGYVDGAYIRLKKKKNGVETIVRDWNTISMLNVDYAINHGKNWSENIRLDYDPDPTVEYSVSVFFPGNSYTKPEDYYHAASARSFFYYFDETGLDISATQQGGFRIKTINTYSEPGILASSKTIKYINSDGTSSGKLLNRFTPLHSVFSFCNICGVHNGGQTTTISEPFNPTFLTSDDYFPGGGNLIGYSRVEEIELSDTSSHGKKVYNYINTINSTKKGFPNISDPLNGELISEEYYNSGGSKVFSKTYSYVNLISPLSYDAVRLVNHAYGNAYINRSGYGGRYRYTYETYPLNSYWYKQQSITTRELLGAQVTSQESFTYNTSGYPKTITSIGSDGIPIYKKYYYATETFDYPVIETTMSNLKMTGIPLRIESYKNTELLYAENTFFAKDATTSNLVLPKSSYSKKGTDLTVLSEKIISYDLYDNYGNILQYSKEGGAPISIIWGYGRNRPIAKIENLTYSSISSGTITNLQSKSNIDSEQNLITALNMLRSSFPNAMVTTYTYKPLVGVTTITDPKGLKTTYEYDSFGRLKAVYDHEGKLLSENEYHYKN